MVLNDSPVWRLTQRNFHGGTRTDDAPDGVTMRLKTETTSEPMALGAEIQEAA